MAGVEGVAEVPEDCGPLAEDLSGMALPNPFCAETELFADDTLLGSDE
jgi:hypothetical protein